MSNTSLYTIDPKKCTESLKKAWLSVDDITKVEFPPGDLGIIIVTANIKQRKVLKYIHKHANIKSEKSWKPFKKPKPKPSPPSSYASAEDNEDTILSPPYDPYNSQMSTHTPNPTVNNQAEFISFPDGLPYQNQYPSNNYSSSSYYPYNSQTPLVSESQTEPEFKYFSDNYPSQVPYSSNYYSSESHDPHSQQHSTVEYDMNQQPPDIHFSPWGGYRYNSPETGQSSGYAYGSNCEPQSSAYAYGSNESQSSGYAYGSNYEPQSSGYGSYGWNEPQSSGYTYGSNYEPQSSGYGSYGWNEPQSSGYGSYGSNQSQSSGYGSYGSNEPQSSGYGHGWNDAQHNNMGGGSSGHNNNTEGCAIM